MSSQTNASLRDVVTEIAHPLTESAQDYDSLMDLIGNSRFVLIGEASHGTHEFYRERARITMRLIEEKNFTAVAVEADWPDAYRINRYVRGYSDDIDSVDSLSGFKRFPSWMWRNADVLDFVSWLRDHNESISENPESSAKTGFYGLDLYSLHTSIEAVLKYLDRVDPIAASKARYRYACFEHFGEDSQSYGYAAGFGLSNTCEQEVVEQLVDIQRNAAQYAKRDGQLAADDFFYAEQNARLVKNAEEYYRSMFLGRVSSWNLRDRHMAETLHMLFSHLESQGQYAKIVVWAHNSHLGDARATDMGRSGEVNIGMLARERYGRDAVLIGLSTYSGTVTAASNWDGPAERIRVRPALPGSCEALFHETGISKFLLPLRQDSTTANVLRQPLLQRATGVIYLPESERASHYFDVRLADQFDALLHFDETRAVGPLERTSEWEAGELPETFPSGI